MFVLTLFARYPRAQSGERKKNPKQRKTTLTYAEQVDSRDVVLKTLALLHGQNAFSYWSASQTAVKGSLSFDLTLFLFFVKNVLTRCDISALWTTNCWTMPGDSRLHTLSWWSSQTWISFISFQLNDSKLCFTRKSLLYAVQNLFPLSDIIYHPTLLPVLLRCWHHIRSERLWPGQDQTKIHTLTNCLQNSPFTLLWLN